jgi:hypothetical protein
MIVLYKIIEMCNKWLSFISNHCCTIPARFIFYILHVSEARVTLHIFWNIKVTTGLLVLHFLSGNIDT